MNLSSLERLNPTSYSLTLEERTGLSVGMRQRYLDENLENKLLFWGKIFGIENDYLISYTTIPTETLHKKKFYYCTTGDYNLRQVPDLTEDFFQQASTQTGRFKGDPSLPLDGGPIDDDDYDEYEENSDDDEDAPKRKERFRELHRLAYTLQLIDHDSFIVPRGAWFVDATHRIVSNPSFSGLSYEAAGSYSSYFHARLPEREASKAALKKSGVLRDGEFLDPISGDLPDGIWALDYDHSHSFVYLRNFYWPGYYFYHDISTKEYGSAYFGDGTANRDLAWML